MVRILTTLILANLLQSPGIDAEVFSVRLAGGQDSCSGRLEVEQNGTWRTLCDYDWNLVNAGVVCRELGCGTAVSASTDCFRPGERRSSLGHIRCRGYESFLYQCERRGSERPRCDYHSVDDVGVVCADLRTMKAPELHLRSSSDTVVRPGQTVYMDCFLPSRLCSSYYAQLSRNGGYIDYQIVRSNTRFVSFTVADLQPWQVGSYRCQYSYHGIKHTSPSSNTITITMDMVPVWVVPVCVAVGLTLLLVGLVVMMYCLVKRQRSSSSL